MVSAAWKRRFGVDRLEPVEIASLLLISGTLVYFAVNCATHGLYISSYFSNDWTDTYMDYFNMVQNLRMGDPYYANANYPAVCFAIFRILFSFSPRAGLPTSGTPREMALGLRAYSPTFIPFMVFVLACTFVIVFSVLRLCRDKTDRCKGLLVAACLFSGPFLFLLERGNILILALTCVFFFFAAYESENRLIRLLGYIALGLAAAIKLYPAVFALMLLCKKRWKAFAVVAAAGLGFLIIPFFWFNGLDSVRAMLAGIGETSVASNYYGLGYNYSFSNLCSIALALAGVKGFPGGLVGTVLPFMMCLLLFFLQKRESLKVLALVLMCVWCPSFSYTYSLTFLLVPFVLLGREDFGCIERLSLSALVLSLLPYALPIVQPVAAVYVDVKFPLAYGGLIGNFALVLLFVTLCVSAIRHAMDLLGRKGSRWLLGQRVI